MSLRLKLLLPSLAVFLVIAIVMHFYWLPRYLEHEYTEQLKNEQGYLQLLETALIPDLINNDFAKVYETLDRVLANRSYWQHLHLYDDRPQRIYPLNNSAYSKETKWLTERLHFDGQAIGELRVWVDFEAMNERHYAYIHTLELILFSVFFTRNSGIGHFSGPMDMEACPSSFCLC